MSCLGCFLFLTVLLILIIISSGRSSPGATKGSSSRPWSPSDSSVDIGEVKTEEGMRVERKADLLLMFVYMHRNSPCFSSLHSVNKESFSCYDIYQLAQQQDVFKSNFVIDVWDSVSSQRRDVPNQDSPLEKFIIANTLSYGNVRPINYEICKF